jgi:branched-chain amino acid transport system substrate-binding protein
MAALHAAKINDIFTDNGVIREDNLMVHDMYVMQVKKPSESKQDWDFYKLVQTMPGDQAFGNPNEACPLVKK